MARKHILMGVVAPVVVLGGAARAAWAVQVPEELERCGTPSAAQPPGARSPRTGPPRGAGPGPVIPVGQLLLPPVEGVGAGAPAGPAISPPQSAPPAPTPPTPGPLPGLPPAKPSGRESEGSSRPRIEAVQARGEVPEERLLDIGVVVFDPGAQQGDPRRGVSADLRRSEARFVSFHLKKTLESTGNWGAVRVVPGPGEGLDVSVSGRLLESNGKRLAIDIEAVDATGRRWLERRYRGEADTSAYRPEQLGRHEAFQEVYNRIANDLLAAREQLDAERLVSLRRVAALRFAAALSPEAFGSYLKRPGRGRFALIHLPAEDDPMARRVAGIRERDQMLVDTLNEHYLSFYESMGGPYANLRMYSYQEQDALDKINRESRLKKILGGLAMLAAMVMTGNTQAERVARDAAFMGGMAALESGLRQAQEAGVHAAALQELATSFDGEVAPLLVEVEGQQVKLTGSAEAQFAAWRELLHQVFSLETGLPGDPNASPVGAAPPSP